MFLAVEGYHLKSTKSYTFPRKVGGFGGRVGAGLIVYSKEKQEDFSKHFLHCEIQIEEARRKTREKE